MKERENAPQLIADEDIDSYLKDFGKQHCIYFHPDTIGWISLIPDEKRTKGAVNFVLYAMGTRPFGIKRGKGPENLQELVDDVQNAYDNVSGATIESVVADIRYPDGSPITLKRFQNSSSPDWIKAIEKGLDYGFFQIKDDGDTIGFNPQVEELFFPKKQS